MPFPSLWETYVGSTCVPGKGAGEELLISWNLLWPPAQEQKDFLSGSTWNPGFRSLEAQEQLKAEMRGTSLLVSG